MLRRVLKTNKKDFSKSCKAKDVGLRANPLGPYVLPRDQVIVNANKSSGFKRPLT